MYTSEKYNKLEKEVSEMKASYNRNREEYDKKVENASFWLGILPGVTTACLVFSYMFDRFDSLFKGLALLSCILSIFFAYHAKSKNYAGKLIQRTTTYLALCSLHRAILYSENPEENYAGFVERYNAIMEKDNSMSLSNTTDLIDVFQKNTQKAFEKEKSMDVKAKSSDVKENGGLDDK